MANSPIPPLAEAISVPTSTRRYYGWVILLVAAAAMVGTLPGRTQGLGLITEPLIKDLSLSRVEYAQINLWATLIGALFCIGIGKLIDRAGSRIVVSTLALALGVVVVTMSRTTSTSVLPILITLTRGLGQSALSVVSLAMVGLWFRRKLDLAMAIYSVVMSIGFMLAFPLVGYVVTHSGWRAAWGGVGWALICLLAPLAALLTRRSPEDIGQVVDGVTEVPAIDALDTVEDRERTSSPSDFTLLRALATPAFWVMSTASALYGLVASGIGLFNESVLKEHGLNPEIYHSSLAVTALTALIGNFLGGFLARRGGMNRLMAVAMLMLAAGLVWFARVRSTTEVMAISSVMGVAGGFVIVLFFTFWARVYGRKHLGMIQGAAQMMTVIASAVGPLVLAECVVQTGSYTNAFYVLAGAMACLAALAWLTRTPVGDEPPNPALAT